MSEVLETTGLKAGQLVYPDGNITIRRGVADGETLVVGDPISFDSNGFMIKASDTVGGNSEGLGVARESTVGAVSGDGGQSIQAVLAPTFVGFVMGGAVPPFQKVKLTSAFKAVANGAPANATTPTAGEVDAVRDYVELNFGRYFGHHKEEKEPTVSADTEIGVIRLGAD